MTEPDYVAAADESLRTSYEEPMGLDEYVDAAFENPTIAAHASKYVLTAIEHEGTRTVVEEGEEKDRYRFFDDPHNAGEHAVLGNTEVLNQFVADLRSIATRRGKQEKLLWLEGPTATGKSELKRCLVNGLEAFSKTDEGRRYTVEWSVAGAADDHQSLTYGGPDPTDDDWYDSPVQAHPLQVFPPEVRARLLEDLNAASDDHIDVRVEGLLDPFSREAYDHLEEHYRRTGTDGLFSSVTSERHLRVKNIVMGIGQGIGVLHSEDDGTAKERLVGSWMHGMLQELDSRGRKNPQAFSYDGVLSQGNGGLTIVEDAAQHADLLQQLLNVPDEGAVKLDKGITMDVDTQLVVISNPDLTARLNQHANREGEDPLKALRRRLDKHRFRYLTNASLEAELIRRELDGEDERWMAESYDDVAERVRESLAVDVREGNGTVTTRELAPHAIGAAAFYSVVTRLDEQDLPDDLSLVDKALLFDRGYLRDGDVRREKDDFEFDDDASDGERGIPVTYTRDVLAELLQSSSDSYHPELPVEDVVMPRDVLNAMAENLSAAPVFSPAECSAFESRVVQVKHHVFDQQETDVVHAAMHDKGVDEATVEEYVEQVSAWVEGETMENDRGERVAPDPLKMKVFEIEHLGRFSESDYDGNEPRDQVEHFRSEKVLSELNRHAWHNRDEEFRAGEVTASEIPSIASVLSEHDWDAVRRTYPDFDPRQWDDPPSGTQTAELKAKTIEAMVDVFGYSQAAAELTSRHVMGQVSYKWD